MKALSIFGRQVRSKMVAVGALAFGLGVAPQAATADQSFSAVVIERAAALEQQADKLRGLSRSKTADSATLRSELEMFRSGVLDLSGAVAEYDASSLNETQRAGYELIKTKLMTLEQIVNSKAAVLENEGLENRRALKDKAANFVYRVQLLAKAAQKVDLPAADENPETE